MIEDAKTAILLFNRWTQGMAEGDFANSKRFTDEFVKSETWKDVGSKNAPIVLMFESFVGAFDIMADIQNYG